MLAKHCRVKRGVRGFTLLELLITLAVVAILAAIAFPSFHEVNVRMRVSGITNEIVHAMHLARAEAAKRGIDVLVESGASWNDGWTVTAGADVLLQRGPVDAEYEIEASSNGGGVNGVITFRPTGQLLDATSFDFNVCRPASDADVAKSKRITVQGSGTVNSRRDVTGSPAGSCS